MTKPNIKPNRRFRSGFTLNELLIVALLMIMVAMMIAQFWKTYSFNLLQYTARVTIATEAKLALQSLAMDFGSAVGLAKIDDNHILICCDSGDYPDGVANWAEPDNLIEYYINNSKLYRYDQSSGIDTVIAAITDSIDAQQTDDQWQITVGLQGYENSKQLVLNWGN